MAVYIPIRPKWNPRGVVVNYVACGQLCVRSWPSHYHDANTDAQQRQRGRIAQVCNALPFVKELLALGYSPRTKRNGRTVGSYHAAVSTALRSWFIQTPQGDTLDLSRMRLTDGIHVPPKGLSVKRIGQDLQIAWAYAIPWQGASILLAAREVASNQWVSLPCRPEQGATCMIIQLPEAWKGKTVETWVAFVGNHSRLKTKTHYEKIAPNRSTAATTTQQYNIQSLTVQLAKKGKRGYALQTECKCNKTAPCRAEQKCKFGLRHVICTYKC